jgi:hypothetical protein
MGHSGHDHAGGGGARGGRATKEAIAVAYHHGPNDRAQFTNSGISHAHAQQAGVSQDAALDRQGELPRVITYEDSVRLCKLPTRTILTHVTDHALFDMHAQFAKFAGAQKLIRLDRRVPNMDGIAESFKKGMEKCPSGIQPWHAFLPALDPNNMPNGFREGFTGETSIVRQYWGVARWDDKDKCWAYDPQAKTFIEVGWAGWRFDQTGLYETKTTFRVVSRWIFCPSLGRYGFKVSAFEKAQAAVMHVADDLLAALRNAKPDELQEAMLHRYPAGRILHPDGTYAAPREEEAEMMDSSVVDEEATDANTASDSQTTIDGPITLPPDTPVEPPTSFPDDFALVEHSGADLANVLPAGVSPKAAVAAPAPAAQQVVVKIALPKERN